MNSVLPSTVHFSPKSEYLGCEIWLNEADIQIWSVKWIQVFIHVIRNVSPERIRLLFNPQVNAILLTIPNESAKLTGMDVVMNGDEEAVIELKYERELLAEVPDTLEPLREDRRDLFGVNLDMTAPVSEFMAEGEPLLCDESLESMESSVVGIHEDLSQSTDLRSSIPSIRAMYEYRTAIFQSFGNEEGCI